MSGPGQKVSELSRQEVDRLFDARNGQVGTQELVEHGIRMAIRFTTCAILQRVTEAKLKTLYVAFGLGVTARETELMRGLIREFERELEAIKPGAGAELTIVTP